MIRGLALITLLMLPGCADQSKGAALNECRMQNYLQDPAAQAHLTPDCMKEKSFETVTACAPTTDEHEWDWQLTTFAYDNPKCYRPIGSAAWTATFLSPL